MHLEEEEKGGRKGILPKGRAYWVSVLRDFKGGPRGISIKYSLAFQMCPFRVMVSTDWLTPGQGSLVNAGGPNVSHGVTCLVFLLFCSWS